MTFALIIPAAGQGARLKAGRPKAFVPVGGKVLLVRTLKAMLGAYPFVEAVVAVDGKMISRARALLERERLGRVRVVAGGATRSGSVRNALEAVTADAVLVHDAARPFVSRRIVRDTVRAVLRSGAALAAVPATATVKRSDPRGRFALRTEDRRTLYLAQTPQGFRTRLLRRRYEALGSRALGMTDEAQLFDGTAVRVRIVAGDSDNIKITTPADLRIAETLLKK